MSPTQPPNPLTDPAVADRLARAGGLILRPISKPTGPPARAPRAEPTPPEEVPAQHWFGVVALEGTWSVDRRLIKRGALSWSCPMPLFDSDRSQVGVVQSVRRVHGGLIVAEGTIGLDGFTPGSAWSQGAIVRVVDVEAQEAVGPIGKALIFNKGHVAAVVLGDMPSWHACRITVDGGRVEDFPITDEVPE